jgi:hypothetical protein
MKIARCDVCNKDQEFKDKFPLVIKEVCNNCSKAKQVIESFTKTVSEDLTPSSSVGFTKQNCKSPSEGLLVGNIDNIFMNYKTNDMMIVEYKSGTSKPYIEKFGQWSIYKELDSVMSMRGSSYKGTFVIWSNKYQLDESTKFKINGVSISKEQLVRFMNIESDAYNPINFENFNSYKAVMSKR